MVPTFFLPMVAEQGIDVGALIDRVVRDPRNELTHKECWILQGYPDPSQWSKAIHAQAPLDLWRMRHLPYRFWMPFLQELASAVIAQWWDARIGDLQMVKADLSSVVSRKRSA